MSKGKKRRRTPKPKPAESEPVVPRASEHATIAPKRSTRQARESRLVSPLPKWDKVKGEVWFRKKLMLSFGRHTAPLVEALLDAWQAANWARAIFDPLDHDAGDDPKRQLENAVSRLNSALLSPWIKFHVRNGCEAEWEDRHPAAGPSQSRQAKPTRPPKRPNDPRGDLGK